VSLALFLWLLVTAFFLLHELDAMTCEEWRIFPGLRSLEPDLGRRIFIWVHLPLFVAFFWFGWHPDAEIQMIFRKAIDAFALIHIGLHLLLRKHPENRFNNPFSWTIIVGWGVTGLLHFLVSGPA
jgi:hypothetical protein